MGRKLKIISLVLGLLLAGIGVYLYAVYARMVVPKLVSPDGKWITEGAAPTPMPTIDPLEPKNVLILGYGGGEHEGGNLSDTMILVHIRPKEKRAVIISIPRDTWVNIPIKAEGMEKSKINAAFAIGNDDKKYPDKSPEYRGRGGGGRLSGAVVTEITGLKVDYFISVNFDAFRKMVDTLGGVEVAVPYSFVDNFYPIKGREKDSCGRSEAEMTALTATVSGQKLEQMFDCRYETIEFVKGTEKMNGDRALKFVRSRHATVGGGDFGRALRQQAFLVAVKDKILRPGSILTAIPLVETISRNLETDIDIKSAIELWQKSNITEVEVKSISLNNDNVLMESFSYDRQFILIPKAGEDNWGGVKQYIGEEIAGKTPTGSPAPSVKLRPTVKRLD